MKLVELFTVLIVYLVLVGTNADHKGPNFNELIPLRKGFSQHINLPKLGRLHWIFQKCCLQSWFSNDLLLDSF